MASDLGRSTLVALFAVLILLTALTATAGEPGAAPRLPIDISSPLSRDVEVVVKPGDHLWKISDRHLRQVMDGSFSPTAVAPYWREVIVLNQPRLRSGDPDLIYPGEVVVLPSERR